MPGMQDEKTEQRLFEAVKRRIARVEGGSKKKPPVDKEKAKAFVKAFKGTE